MGIYFLPLLSWLWIGGCVNTPVQQDLSQGVVVYEISYPELDSNDLRVQMFPSEMELRFKNDKYKTVLNAAGGIFQTCFISNAQDYNLTHGVKVFSEKYAMRVGVDGVKDLHKDYPKHSITFLDEEKEIAGLPCKKVVINFGISRKESLFFYHTDFIQLKDPNWSTPFPEISGVLLDYQIESHGTVMHLKAKEIRSELIDDAEFSLSSDYELLPMDEFMPKIQANIDAFN